MLEFLPQRHIFDRLAERANTVPVYCQLLSDQLTPVSAYERLSGDAEYAFLLESVVGGENIARYSFLGLDPIAVIESTDGTTTISRDGKENTIESTDPLATLQRVLADYRVAQPTALPRFLGGGVGFATYDLARAYASNKLDNTPQDDRHLPDMLFGIYDRMVIFDHVRKLMIIVAHAHCDEAKSLDAAFEKACSQLQAIVNKLTTVAPEPVRPLVQQVDDTISYESNMSRETFERAVDTCKSYIRAGDVFQVVISQRLSATTKARPFDIYRALRVINPSPFMFYLKSPKVSLVGASPEILCRIEGDTVSTRPLAGTRPRGRSEAEDLGLEKELLADPKERAEHVMLVDLGRNDLGRVCKQGSVSIDDLMSIERYSHVMHICSHVSGILSEDKSGIDALRAVLPVGTVSGAPKIRAMQIIDELETVKRGPYAGAVGYIDFAGNMDTCITLRTLVITPGDDGMHRVDAQVGAGIVADSEPSQEYQETLNKAQSMLSALSLANAWLNEPC